MAGFSRREFIKVAGAGAAVAVGSGLTSRWWGADGDPLHDPATDGDQVIPTMCELCFWKCGVLAHVKGGRLTKIVGNPLHPLSRGRLCPRGTGGAGLLYDPDRLKKPQLRRSKRGEQVFEEVSWEAALDEMATRLDKIRRDYGPEALALFVHGHGGAWFQQLVGAYGTPNVAQPSFAQCRGPRDVGFNLTYGNGVGSPEITDIANARCITLIGTHLGENMHNTQVQEMALAIERGAEMVVVDPRFSTAAGKARYWLPIKPGTDMALLLAWMHVILAEGLYDREYLARYATGLDELKAHVQDKTPEWAYTRTTIEPEMIVETARFIAASRPASLIHPGRHVTWYGDDTQRSRAIAMLNALLGSYGRRGGFFLPAQLKVPAFPGPTLPKPKRGLVDAPKGRPWPFADEPVASGIRDASIPGTADYDIKAWMVYGTNLIQSLPQPDKTLEALGHLDFIAAIDVLPAEITGWADVVLPEATYLERFDPIHNPGWREPYAAVRQPVVEPMYDSKPGWWIARELATRLGLAAWFPWKDSTEVARRRAEAGGIDFGALCKDGVVLGKPTPTCIEDGLEPSFNTPSKKIELFSQQLADAGLPPMPEYTPPEEPPDGSFRLLFGRSPVHTFGRTTNNRFLSQILATNVLWVNARAAREQGLRDGEKVVLVNQDGVKSEPIAVRATQRIRPDCVYMVHGYGHDSKGLTFARGRGASDSRLTTRQKTDPIMGGTGMNVNFVRIERTLV